jgi:2-polyprenyl-6-methoxyphenol hydroxylase-like FAD-dependent oxidoreductase
LIVQRLSTFSSSSEPNVKKADVLIVGGGIAGTSLACALSQSEYFENSPEDKLKKIVLLDNSKLP